MTLQEVMSELEAAGTEQNRKIYTRHGASPPMFGVSFALLETLKKRIKVDHDLARALWGTGNYDARNLATKIADPKRFDEALADAWVNDVNSYTLADVYALLVGQTPVARDRLEAWIESGSEWTARTGWQLLAVLAMKDVSLPDDFFERRVERIEREIHSSPNRVRDAMLNALSAIGMRNDALEAKVVPAVHRIGKVVVDHGETGCKTPDPLEYIEKAKSRKTRAQKDIRAR